MGETIDNIEIEKRAERMARKLEYYDELKKALDIRQQIKIWLKRASFNEFCAEIEKSIIGQPNLRIFLGNVYHYLTCIDKGYPINHNVLLAAPSGSGKTETYRALKKYFNRAIPSLPVFIVDASQLTSTGFKGSNPTEILAPFIRRDLQDAIGLCFMDEFDKKLTPSFDGHGKNVNAEVQANLLTIVEGSEITDGKGHTINTSKVMFIGLGSYDSFRNTREDDKKTIGFGTEEDDVATEHFKYLERENLIEVGGSHELIGRFPIIINFDRLSDEAIDKIIEKDIGLLENIYNCDITISEEMRDLLREGANSKFGCRSIDSSLRAMVLQEYTKSLGIENEGSLVIVLSGEESSHYYVEMEPELEQANEKEVICGDEEEASPFDM